MEPLLGFEDDITAVDNGENLSSSVLSTSQGYKLVPWLNWDEWECVRDSLFSDSPDKIAFAMNRISTWRSRGCLPVVIDVTAAIIEIQQKDPLYRKDLPDDVIHSEQMLAMLYCMAILRLVNCVVEKTRKKTEISIAEAAGAIGIPRTLIDVRHEGSHRDLPALPLVRDSAAKAIQWLRSYYWVPQTNQIPYQRDGTYKIRKEIKSRLHELVSCLKVNKSDRNGSSLVKGKRFKHQEQLCGRNKFFSLMSSKLHSSKTAGSKKQISKILKFLVRLYSSFSSEVLSVLLEFFLKAIDSSNLVELPEDHQVGQRTPNLLDDWKIVTIKFSNKEPKLLIMLLKAVLDKIHTQEAMKYEADLTSLDCGTWTGQTEQLSSLFSWLVGQLKELKSLYKKDTTTKTKASSTGMNISNAILLEILQKCLLVSSCGHRQLMDSALQLAELMGDSYLMEKLNKLSLLLSESNVARENPSLTSTNNFITQEAESIHQATKKLELIKLHKTKSKALMVTDVGLGSSGRWVVAKSWNPCPIGMLPSDLGSSGQLPVLESNEEDKKSADSSEGRQIRELKQSSNMTEPHCDINSSDIPDVEKSYSKREASCDIYLLDNRSSAKKMRQTLESFESDGEDAWLSESVEGCLMIDGVWKKVGKEELLAIESNVRILV